METEGPLMSFWTSPAAPQTALTLSLGPPEAPFLPSFQAGGQHSRQGKGAGAGRDGPGSPLLLLASPTDTRKVLLPPRGTVSPLACCPRVPKPPPSSPPPRQLQAPGRILHSVGLGVEGRGAWALTSARRVHTRPVTTLH